MLVTKRFRNVVKHQRAPEGKNSLFAPHKSFLKTISLKPQQNFESVVAVSLQHETWQYWSLH